jgi:hypothetical protein
MKSKQGRGREGKVYTRIKEDTIQRIAINIAITFEVHAYTVVSPHPNIHQQPNAPNGGYRPFSPNNPALSATFLPPPLAPPPTPLPLSPLAVHTFYV